MNNEINHKQPILAFIIVGIIAAIGVAILEYYLVEPLISKILPDSQFANAVLVILSMACMFEIGRRANQLEVKTILADFISKVAVIIWTATGIIFASLNFYASNKKIVPAVVVMIIIILLHLFTGLMMVKVGNEITAYIGEYKQKKLAKLTQQKPHHKINTRIWWITAFFALVCLVELVVDYELIEKVFVDGMGFTTFTALMISITAVGASMFCMFERGWLHAEAIKMEDGARYKVTQKLLVGIWLAIAGALFLIRFYDTDAEAINILKADSWINAIIMMGLFGMTGLLANKIGAEFPDYTYMIRIKQSRRRYRSKELQLHQISETIELLNEKLNYYNTTQKLLEQQVELAINSLPDKIETIKMESIEQPLKNATGLRISSVSHETTQA